MISVVKSESGNRMSQVYVIEFGDIRIYPFPNRKDSQTSLYCYFMDYVVTEKLHSDNA